VSVAHVLLARLRRERGQTFVEYALILAVVVVGVLLAATWTGIGASLQAAIGVVAGAV
jgi:Flp pilus assembly pilin Flp